MAKKGEIGAKNATRQEALDRREMACSLLRKRQPTGMVKQAMIRLYGISWRMANVYIARARKVLLEESGRPANELRADAYALYVGMIENGKLPPLTRLRAQELLVKLFGLEGPVKVAQTDSQGNDIATDEEGTLFAEVLGIACRRRTVGATPSGNGSNGSADAPGAAS